MRAVTEEDDLAWLGTVAADKGVATLTLEIILLVLGVLTHIVTPASISRLVPANVMPAGYQHTWRKYWALNVAIPPPRTCPLGLDRVVAVAPLTEVSQTLVPIGRVGPIAKLG